VFSTLNGAAVNRIVKLNPITGARYSFNAPVIPAGKPVFTLDYAPRGPHAGSVFAGGDFSVNGQERLGKKGVSFDHNSGASTGWNPNADAGIQTLKVSPDGNWVYIGGTFEVVGGQARNDLAKTAAGNGAVQAVSYHSAINGLVQAHVLSITVDADNATIYATTGPERPVGSSGGNKLFRFASTGSEVWHVSFKGDAQAVVLVGSTLYAGFHGGFNCASPGAPGCVFRTLGFTTSSNQTSFSPNSDGALGVRGLAVASGGNRLVAVGDFSVMGRTSKLHGVAIFN